MLDVNFIRQNQALVEKSTREKGYNVNISDLLALDDKRKSLLQSVDELRRQRNEIASRMKGGKPSAELIAEGKAIRDQLAAK